MITTIPAGYRLSITSWENDADYYRTVTLEGLSRPVTQFLVEFAKLFYSKNNYNYRGPKGFGNMYEPSDELAPALEAAKKVLIEHHSALCVHYGEDISVESLDDHDMLYDTVSDLHYTLFGGGEFHFRVFESYKVEAIPADITIEDVTVQF